MKKTKFALMQSAIALVLCVSMLVGTTFAWFTDSVTSGVNQIAAGTLDVELEYLNQAGKWTPVREDSNVFDPDALWEPGHTEVVYLRISNQGNLALKYQLGVNIAEETPSVNTKNEIFKLSDHIRFGLEADRDGKTAPWADRAAAIGAVSGVSQPIRVGYSSGGTLDAGGEKYMAMAVYMPESVGNEANYMTGATPPQILLGLQLVATQVNKEQDSFGSDYDEGLEFPALKPGSVTANVKSENGKVAEAATLTGDGIGATVPAGVAVEGGSVTLSVSELNSSEANITLGKNEILRSLDVHMAGVAKDNTVPMIITIEKAMMTGLNMGNYTLYHVEDGVAKAMTHVASVAELKEHNQFAYDPATGDVTLALATFSEVAMVAEESKWEGNFDYSWYTNAVAPIDGENVTEYTIANADQLAAFGAIVGGMAEGIEQDSFSDKTVKLISDINLGDKESENNPDIIFYPIGYWNSEGTYEKNTAEATEALSSGFYTFEGTFDGNGHSVSNFYQNTWEMKGDHNWYDPIKEQYYRDGMGLFGKVYGGTVKNLTIKNFSSDGEIATTGVVAAYADGATFENIAIFNCNPRVYNIGNGGIVGCVGWYAKEKGLTTTFKNVTVDNSNKISALWGSYDVACGGIVGQYYPTSGQSSANYPVNAGIEFTNCHVAAQMDVYNDVCANYQYYAYRYSGMLIGSVRENETIDGHVYPKMDGITASGCTVHFGTWNDYYYCEIIDNTTASYTHDYQMSRLTEIKAIDGTTVTYLDGTTGTVPASGRANYVIVDYSADKGHGTENATCYHFKDGKVWNHSDAGTEIVDGKEVLVEDKQHIYLEFKNLVTGYGWGVTSRGFNNLDGVTNLDITVGDQQTSVEKFETNDDISHEISTMTFKAGQTVFVGDLFKEKSSAARIVGVERGTIDVKNLQVFVSPVGKDSTASGVFVRNENDWRLGKLTFSGSGAAKLTITDYHFCIETTVNIEVTSDESVHETLFGKFEMKFTNEKFTYRVGNQNKVNLESLFSAIENRVISNLKIKITCVSGNASGEYNPNINEWEKGTIQFSGTGVVKVTISADGAKPVELTLEVVDAVNATTATNATSNNVVLLQDCGFSSLEVSGGYTLYGNGFTMTCSTDSYAKDFGYAFVTLEDGTLDNVQIVCPNFDYAALYKSNLTSSDNRSYTDSSGTIRYYNARSGVMVSGNSQILNSRISGARAAVNVTGGNCVIDNSRIELGAVASLLVGAANSLTLRDVTLVQKPTASTYDPSKTLMGFSVLYMCDSEGKATPTTLEGTLVQFAWVNADDKKYVPSAAQDIVDGVMKETAFIHNINGKDSLNLGFAYMPEDAQKTVDAPDNITDNRTDKDTIPYEMKDVKVQISILSTTVYVCSYKNTNGTAESFKTESEYVPNKYSDIITVTYSDTADGLTTGKSFGTDGWVYELNVDLDKLSGYALDFSKLTMNVNGVAVTDFKVNGNAKPTSPVAVTAGGVTYTLTATIDGKEYTATYKVTGTETSKESPSLVATNYEAGLCVASSYGSTWHGAAPALEGIQIKYWSVAEKQYKTINLSDYTPTTKGQLNGTNTTWTYTHKNGDFTLTLTGGQVHSSNNVYAMPVVCDGKLYFVAASSKGLVNSGNSARTIPVTYTFKDNNNGDVLTFSHTWSVAENKDAQYNYSDFCSGTLTKLESSGGGGGGSCITPDTLITLADGTQVRVDSLKGDEMLLVWNMETGKLDSAPLMFVDSDPETEYEIVHLYFSDGTDVKVIYEHGFWDYDLNKYVYLDANAADYIGHTFAKQNGDELTKVQLTDVVIETEVTTAWSPVTAGHLCYFVNGMLSMPGGVGGLFNIFDVDPETMTYDAEAMQRDIETYGLYTYEELNAICPLSEEMFHAAGGAYLKISIGKGNLTEDELINMINRYSKFFE